MKTIEERANSLLNKFGTGNFVHEKSGVMVSDLMIEFAKKEVDKTRSKDNFKLKAEHLYHIKNAIDANILTYDAIIEFSMVDDEDENLIKEAKEANLSVSLLMEEILSQHNPK